MTTSPRAEQVVPPVGVGVSSNVETQKTPAGKAVPSSPGRYPRVTADSAQTSAASATWTKAEPNTLMERVLAPANMKRAYQRVVSNKGAPGADGMTVSDLVGYLKQYWPTLRGRLLRGEYHPQVVRSVEIPKPQGGTRQLGIPSVVDRLIQQALLQQHTPIFDPLFSEYSYGFRPGRSAHQSVEAARSHVAAGCRWSVELDLEKFFDRVNHDLLMAQVEAQVEDKPALRLIRRYLEAGLSSPMPAMLLRVHFSRAWPAPTNRQCRIKLALASSLQGASPVQTPRIDSRATWERSKSSLG